jgi:hypothetical protein
MVAAIKGMQETQPALLIAIPTVFRACRYVTGRHPFVTMTLVNPVTVNACRR